MKRVLYLRHGQSETNLKGIFAGGQDNTPLTDMGRDQARQAAQELRKEKIDRIIASPLDRTRETAEIVAQVIGFEPTVIEFDARLQEYDIGAGNGVPVQGMTSAKLVAFPGAENPVAFAKRVKESLQDIVNLDGTTLIVGHAGVGRVIECLRTNYDPAKFFDKAGYPNAHAVELDLSWLTQR